MSLWRMEYCIQSNRRRKIQTVQTQPWDCSRVVHSDSSYHFSAVLGVKSSLEYRSHHSQEGVMTFSEEAAIESFLNPWVFKFSLSLSGKVSRPALNFGIVWFDLAHYVFLLPTWFKQSQKGNREGLSQSPMRLKGNLQEWQKLTYSKSTKLI